MRAHAGEARTDVRADVAELVADGAGRGEGGLALRDVARLLDDRTELGDRFVLRLHRRAEDFIEHVARALRDVLVGMGAKAGEVRRADAAHVDGLRGHRVEQRERPIGALEQHVEGGGLRVGGELRKGGNERLARPPARSSRRARR